MKTIWRTTGGLILGGALLLPAAQAATGLAIHRCLRWILETLLEDWL